MDKEQLGVALLLKGHPVMAEKSAYKIRYLGVLKYFAHKYSKEDVFTQAVMQTYCATLGVDAECAYEEEKIKKEIVRVGGMRFKGFKLFTYRYVLLIDCLFMNAFFDKAKASIILEEIKAIFKKRYHPKLEQLFANLYADNGEASDTTAALQLEAWRKNRQFWTKKAMTVLVTANMSAGKSTLINALVGKKVNRTQNDTCTAKIHYIFNKPYEDNLSYEWDNLLNLNANQDTLMTDDANNQSTAISVGTFFRSPSLNQSRLCLIDTPGVNSSLDTEHRELTYQTVSSQPFDKLLYVINGENIGTCDDQKYLSRISQQVPSEKIIFVVNKLDRYKQGEDSVAETIQKQRDQLSGLGIADAIICPVSAYAGLLAKKALFGQPLDEDEADELRLFIRKFKNPEYDLSRFYDAERAGERAWLQELELSSKNAKDYCELLACSGLASLESIIVNR